MAKTLYEHASTPLTRIAHIQAWVSITTNNNDYLANIAILFDFATQLNVLTNSVAGYFYSTDYAVTGAEYFTNKVTVDTCGFEIDVGLTTTTM